MIKQFSQHFYKNVFTNILYSHSKKLQYYVTSAPYYIFDTDLLLSALNVQGIGAAMHMKHTVRA